jgi:hypothetical protein
MGRHGSAMGQDVRARAAPVAVFTCRNK